MLPMFGNKDQVVQFIRSDNKSRLALLNKMNKESQGRNHIYTLFLIEQSSYQIFNDSIKSYSLLVGNNLTFRNFKFYYLFGLTTLKPFTSISAVIIEDYDQVSVDSLKIYLGANYNKIINDNFSVSLGLGVKLLDGLILIFNQDNKPEVNEFIKLNPYISAEFSLRDDKEDLVVNLSLKISPPKLMARDYTKVLFNMFNFGLSIKIKSYTW